MLKITIFGNKILCVLELKEKLIKYSANLNFNTIIKDIEPFLFNPSDSQKIKLFNDYIQQIEL